MNLERWCQLSKREQLLNIKSELFRAVNWQYKDTDIFQGCLTRALDLIGTSFNDPKWHDDLIQIIVLYEEVAKVYINQTQNIKSIYNAI
jgi:hypothetical protein